MNKIDFRHSIAIINGVEYELGMSLRVQVLYEKMMMTVGEGEATLRTIVYFYAVLMGLNPDFKMEFDAFFKYLNEHPFMYKGFMQWLEKDRSPLSYFDAPSEDQKEADDKKKD